MKTIKPDKELIVLTSKALDVIRICAEAAGRITAAAAYPVVVMDGEARRPKPGDQLYPLPKE